MSKKSISLVLGSGGARGLAHIGVIRWLEENDFEIKSISGCSMGALIGGFYAAGKLDNYVEWIKNIDILDMLKLLDFKGSGGFVSGEALMKKMEELAGNPLIEDLDIKFTAVATNIDEEKEVWINEGRLLEAIRASISLPLFFTPYSRNGSLLVDGAVLNPVPIAPSFNDSTDLTIAVNLSGEALAESPIKKEKEDSYFSKKIKKYMSKISIPDSIAKEDGMYVVANKSFETMQGSIARMKLAAYPPDIEIKIPRNLCSMFEFTRSKEIIEYGYKVTKETLEKHEALSLKV
ncbi:MAG: patatin-like phospholipase family protein [Sulfurimonas sp.]|uniref:patatin-like phospholipase family protein n=1 Tax=Sulfurimonas sp. TaxID=2022749 RepID=UPI0025FD8C2C|nr:patatin-like phospholipase family protein [Sulfurimonas sp.]MCK9491527.1 patatin-like phospholipase family protein [Sulfurimonas sp.]